MHVNTQACKHTQNSPTHLYANTNAFTSHDSEGAKQGADEDVDKDVLLAVAWHVEEDQHQGKDHHQDGEDDEHCRMERMASLEVNKFTSTKNNKKTLGAH